MPTPDNDRFETYLKQFRPLVPDPLPLDASEHARPRRGHIGLWGIGVAAVIILGMLGFRVVEKRVSGGPGKSESISANAPLQPLTMRDANALLAASPSYKAALDSMAVRQRYSTVPRDKQSALAVLAKEKNTL